MRFILTLQSRMKRLGNCLQRQGIDPRGRVPSSALAGHTVHVWVPQSRPSASTGAIRGEAQPPRPQATRTTGPHNAPEAAPHGPGASPSPSSRRPGRVGDRSVSARQTIRHQESPAPLPSDAWYPSRKRDGIGTEIARPSAASRTTLPVRLRGAGRPLRRRAHGVRGSVSGSRTLLW